MLFRFLWSCLWVTALAAQSTPSLMSPVADQRHLLPPNLGAATGCALADWNGDGRIDVARVIGDEMVVLLQDKAGRFAPVGLQAWAAFPNAGGIRSIAAGQFDADRFLDIVVGLGGAPDQVLRGDGAGGFTLRQPSPIPRTSFNSTRAILVGNFDRLYGDDLLILAQFATPVLLLADGSGGFKYSSARLPTNFLPGFSTGDAVDIDGDGDLDLVLASDQRSLPLVLYNDGRADFRAKFISLSVTMTVRQVATGDIDGDSLQDLVFLGQSAGALQPPVFWRNTGTGFVPIANLPIFGSMRVRTIAFRHLNRDKLSDLIAVDEAGRVLCAINVGSGAFKLSQDLLGEGSRSSLAVADLEGDGDLDIFVAGHDSEDAVLFGNGTGRFFDPRAIGQRLPNTLGGQMTTVVDLNGDHDPDLLFYDHVGKPTTWVNVNGSRFEKRTGLAPVLPAGGGYFEVKSASFGNATTDLIVLGPAGPANPQGLRCLALTLTGYQDVTARLWPQSANSLYSSVVSGHFTRSTGPSELVLADAGQKLRLFRMVSGWYQEVPGVFSTAVVGGVQDLLAGDINNDGLDDLVVLTGVGSPVVFLGQRTGFVYGGQVGTSVSQAVSGELVDVTGDRLLDLILATPRKATGMQLLLGDGLGKFRDGTTRWLAGLSAPGAEAVAYIESRGESFLVVGRPGQHDVVLVRGLIGYNRIGTTWMHGSRDTTGFICTDLDGDNDEDLVVLRRDAGPALLWNRDVQLTQLGTGQAGRELVLSLEGWPNSQAYLFMSTATMRFNLPGFGLLRLFSPLSLGAVPVPPGGRATISIALAPGLTAAEFPFQIAVVDMVTLRIQLSNLEPIVLTGH